MTKQPALNEIFQELERRLEEKVKQIQQKPIITNSGTPRKNSWTQKIVDKVKISDLANEFGVDKCPECEYPICFDDSRGWFICVRAKYDKCCDFKGNIVDFTERFL